ncbi:BglG family transcription antiterminator [Peptacetobacter sp.]|uniref:BglG family transcription antiterminator n=1 Tax=Peptacetobacter sp. TaxID=2991975 RepID=UPI00262270C4|nr:PTS sugar transporter subunit IIA [Peptacetobacter sp.]
MRTLKIIKELSSTNKYLSIDYFINKLSISKRTIQKELSYINKISKKNGFDLIQKRGKGYLLRIDDTEKFGNFLKELDYYEIKEFTIDNLIAYLSIQNNYVVTEDIANYFEVSVSSIRNQVRKIDFYLEKFNLSIDRKAHYGLKIKEELINRKNLINQLLSKKNKIILEEMNDTFSDRFKNLKRIISNYIKEKEYSINDSEREKIINNIKVILYINKKNEILKRQSYKDKYINDIQDYYEIGISLNDYKEITNTFDKFVINKEKSESKITIENLKKDINIFIKEIDKEYNTNFYKDEDFKRLLTTHVSLLIERLRLKVSYTNVLIEEILIRYPMIFNIAIKFANMISEKYEVIITEEEVGFIATHFCVHMEKEGYRNYLNIEKIAIVCSSGGGSSYLLQMKIINLFKNSNIKTFSFYDIKSIEEFEPDIIFSIKELDLSISVPVIIIKEFLDDNDMLNIKKLLLFTDRDKQVSLNETKNVFIKNILKKEYFSIDYTNENYIDIISEMAEEIEKDGIGGAEYKNRVLERESYVSTIYTNGIAIPHPIEMGSNEDLVSIKILKNEVFYKDKKVNIIFMVSLQKKNYELQKEITKSLYNLIQDIEIIKKLHKAKTYEEFIAIIEPFI